MKEEWKHISGTNGTYLVSNKTRIKSRNEKNHKGEIILKQIIRLGYCEVGLHINNKKCIKKVHRLVAEAFIPNPENKPFINHINGDKSDNRIENLEWCTASENSKHAFSIGLSKPLKGEDNYMFGRCGKLSPNYGRRREGKKGILNHNYGKRGSQCPNSKSVKMILPDGTEKVFVNARIASTETGAQYQNISKCCLGIRNKASGAKWEYIK